MSSKLKVLFWDIETSLMEVAVWGLRYNDYINPDNILKDWHLISASWSWLGEKKVYTAKNYKGNNDKALVILLANLLSKADILVHHNGDVFDVRKLQARMAYHHIAPAYTKLRTVDTKKEAKKHLASSSNTLAYLAKFLGVTPKRHSEYSYWMKELTGNQKEKRIAIDKIGKYNPGDVITLKGVYKILLPFLDVPNMQNGDRKACINCGSKRVQNRGLGATKAGIVKQRRQCYDCHKCFYVKVGGVKK